MLFPFPDYIIAEAVSIPHPALSNATLGRDRLPTRSVMALAYLFQCDYDDLVGWCNDSLDDPALTAELPCIESGIDTDIPDHPYWLISKLRNIKPLYYDASSA
jgi:hypothetical protein